MGLGNPYKGHEAEKNLTYGKSRRWKKESEGSGTRRSLRSRWAQECKALQVSQGKDLEFGDFGGISAVERHTHI